MDRHLFEHKVLRSVGAKIGTKGIETGNRLTNGRRQCICIQRAFQRKGNYVGMRT